MKTIVITGSTRGIGYGLADAFLMHGERVVISGRKQETVDRRSANFRRSTARSEPPGSPAT